MSRASGYRGGQAQSGMLPIRGQQAWDCHYSLWTLSVPCASMDLQFHKEAPLFQKVGAGILTGAGGQAGTGVY